MISNISNGMLLLVCIEVGDDEIKISKAVEKIAKSIT